MVPENRRRRRSRPVDGWPTVRMDAGRSPRAAQRSRMVKIEMIDAIARAIQINHRINSSLTASIFKKITDALLAPIYSSSLRDPRRTRLFSTPQLKTNQRIAFAKSSD
ncbi:hypothetical protein [Burkholderia territorii]|uniref:hypothetical protein n=1 Tax=Burkholderia territorii TaxID=1503055 RepID=UPI0012D8EA93|nr:hypothetical protein [Burkholderia territorii]